MGRRWGQHFLRSEPVIAKIVASAAIKKSESVLEIGPGEGVLTKHLCQLADQVHAYEIDPILCGSLRAAGIENLTVHEGDFLKQSFEALAHQEPWTVVANLPYYITAPILEKLCWQRCLPFRSATLMTQDEVAQRLCHPSSRHAGAITYIVGAFHRVEYLFKVPPGCFDPPPKVDSAVIKIVPTTEATADGPVDADLTRRYERLVATAFGQRRKQLGRSLRSISPSSPEILEGAGIDSKRRPETLTVQEFWALARTWSNHV